VPVIGQLQLHNSGGYVARLGAKWIQPDGSYGSGGFDDDTDVGETGTIDPGDYGCPPGAPVWAAVYVVWGDDKQGSAQDGLIFEPGDEHVGKYSMKGTTLDDPFKFDGVEPPE
jgi:hypothetical protein